MGKKQLRVQVASTMLRNLTGSSLMRVILALAFSAVFCLVEGVRYPLILPLLLALYYRKHLVFEILLMVHIIESSMGMWSYYSRIDKYIYLGGIPMKSLDHISKLSLDHKIEAVLSINENFELNAVTIAGCPVSPAEWKKEDVQHHQLVSIDFQPPSHELLDEGADWMKKQVDEKRAVYVHCKSGIGRSASIVAAYFMKHKRLSAEEASNFIRNQRPEIFKPTSSQMANLLEYEKLIRQDQKFSAQP